MREKIYCTRIAFGMLLVGRGISSARWDGMSGAPTAKAAFSIPRQNAKASLDQPVSFVMSSQTKALDA